MADFQYKTSGGAAWADVPDYAWADGAEGGYGPVARPPDYAELTVSGVPCGAVGKPAIELQIGLLRGDGYAWWVGKVGAFWLTAWDPTTGAWDQYTGYLKRPTWERVEVGSSTSNTRYYNVRVEVVECTAV